MNKSELGQAGTGGFLNKRISMAQGMEGGGDKLWLKPKVRA